MPSNVTRKQAQSIVEHSLGLTLSPAGIHGWDKELDKKLDINLRLPHNSPWQDKYTTGKIQLHPSNNILCFDIDMHPTTIHHDADTNSSTLTTIIHNQSITLPLGFYTQSTREGKYHVYYSTAQSTLQNKQFRLLSFHGTQIDVFTNGTVFEWHSFTPYQNIIHDHPLTPIPSQLERLITTYISTLHVDTKPTTLVVASNRERQYWAELLLSTSWDKFSQKQKNKFFRVIFPKEHLVRSTKQDFSKYKLSYALINSIAVKLTTTKQLSFEQAVDTLLVIVTKLGGNPDSTKTYTILHKNILPQLPQHEAIPDYSDSEDYPLLESLKLQAITTPLFKWIENGNVVYTEVDISTMEPVVHNGTTRLKKDAATTLHPELIEQGPDGKYRWSDRYLPLVETQSNPYQPRLTVDDYGREVYNLYTPSIYVKQAEPSASLPTNVITKALLSIMSEQYIDLYHHYMAHIVFSDSSPMMILWIAALDQKKGGSGKSFSTIELPSLILKSAAAQIDIKSLTSGWGDMVSNVRLLSLEDMADISSREWNDVYSTIKKMKSAAYKKLNMKGSSVSTGRVSVTLTGSSNFRPKLSQSDRRFWCIEPAHLHGITEPLNHEERIELAKLTDSHIYSEDLQQLVNYWAYLYQAEPDKYSNEIYIESPETHYRAKWIAGAASPTQRIVPAITLPTELDALIKHDFDKQGINLEQLLRFLLATYSDKTQKVALPWAWFKELLPYVISDDYSEKHRSKSAIESMLGVDFISNPGIEYTDFKDSVWCKQHNIPVECSTWAISGLVFRLTAEDIEVYRQMLITAMGTSVDTTIIEDPEL